MTDNSIEMEWMSELLGSYLKPLLGIIDIRLTETNGWLMVLCAREANATHYTIY